MGLAAAMYDDTFDGYFPYIYNISGNVVISFDDQLGLFDGRNLTEAQRFDSDNAFKQVNNIYHCPGSKVPFNAAGAPGHNNIGIRSYVINGGGANFSGQTTLTKSNVLGVPGDDSWVRKVNVVNRPENTILISEHHQIFNTIGRASGDKEGRHMADVFGPAGILINNPDHAVGGELDGYFVHGPKQFTFNYLFVDGHVEAMPMPKSFEQGPNASLNYTSFFTNPSAINLSDTMWDAIQN
ncbi:MAG: hypothetical protein MK193_03610 [Lentisphaeria bacterium]|nr:hypothetical protein [Lentisphaeria bacterium]